MKKTILLIALLFFNCSGGSNGAVGTAEEKSEVESDTKASVRNEGRGLDNEYDGERIRIAEEKQQEVGDQTLFPKPAPAEDDSLPDISKTAEFEELLNLKASGQPFKQLPFLSQEELEVLFSERLQLPLKEFYNPQQQELYAKYLSCNPSGPKNPSTCTLKKNYKGENVFLSSNPKRSSTLVVRGFSARKLYEQMHVHQGFSLMRPLKLSCEEKALKCWRPLMSKQTEKYVCHLSFDPRTGMPHFQEKIQRKQSYQDFQNGGSILYKFFAGSWGSCSIIKDWQCPCAQIDLTFDPVESFLLFHLQQTLPEHRLLSLIAHPTNEEVGTQILHRINVMKTGIKCQGVASVFNPVRKSKLKNYAYTCEYRKSFP